jgi:hypothetical protein
MEQHTAIPSGVSDPDGFTADVRGGQPSRRCCCCCCCCCCCIGREAAGSGGSMTKSRSTLISTHELPSAKSREALSRAEGAQPPPPQKFCRGRMSAGGATGFDQFSNIRGDVNEVPRLSRRAPSPVQPSACLRLRAAACCERGAGCGMRRVACFYPSAAGLEPPRPQPTACSVRGACARWNR